MGTIRLVGLDLDGTLLAADGRVAPATLAALREAVDRGVHVALVTGRSAGSAGYHARQLGRFIGRAVGYAACNGGGIYDPSGRPQRLRPIAPDLLEAALEVARGPGLLVSVYGREHVFVEAPWRHVLAFWGPRRPPVWRWPRALAETLRFGAQNRIRWVRDVRSLARPGAEPVLKLFVTPRGSAPAEGGRSLSGPWKGFGTSVDPGAEGLRLLDAAARRVAEVAPGLHVTRSGGDNIEITAPGVHKGWALGELARMYGARREETAAIGDGPNDVEMLEFAGMGIAMGNAPPEVRARADRVAPPVWEDGAARALRQYVLGEG